MLPPIKLLQKLMTALRLLTLPIVFINELLNSRVRAFHSLLELHDPKSWCIVTVAERIHGACRRTESSVAKVPVTEDRYMGPRQIGSYVREKAWRNKNPGCWKLRATSISRFRQGDDG